MAWCLFGGKPPVTIITGLDNTYFTSLAHRPKDQGYFKNMYGLLNLSVKIKNFDVV